MKRSFLVVICLCLLVVVSLAFTKSDPVYKNLKVLPQDITEHQMDSVMNHFSVALGTDCNFCHKQDKKTFEWDYASDEVKHKLIAREMMVMTNEINDKYFDYTGAERTINTQLMVTCFSCHHGSKMPDTEPQKEKN